MLTIKNLHAKAGEKIILKGIELQVRPGEVHAIMGPNGSGKSTFANVLAGRDTVSVTEGEMLYQNQSLFELNAEQRAQQGIFLGFQYPVEIPGVSNIYFLKAALNAQRKAQGLPDVDAMEFLKLVKQTMKDMDIPEEFLYRFVNEGFSGGEKKRNEILQMAVLQPKLMILDEIDSGLDIDALKVVSDGINRLRSPERAIILITHYQRLLNYITPDFVHVLSKGKIVKSGDRSLAHKLEEYGYGFIENTVGESS